MYTISVAMALPFSLFGVPLLFSLFLIPVFLMLFKHMEEKQKLEISVSVKVLMQAMIAVVALWLAAKLIASRVPGGGAGYMVSYYGKYTLLPAILVLLILDIVVLFRSYGKKIALAAITVAIVAGAVRIAAPFWKMHTYETQWQQYCETAKDEFNLEGENIEQLQLYNFVANGKFIKQKDGEMRRSGTEYLGRELLARGLITEYESSDKSAPRPYRASLEFGQELKIPIKKTTATYQVSHETKNVTIGTGGKRWFTQQDISIKNIHTGKVVAHRVQFIDHFKGSRSCAQLYNNQISTVDFLEQAIKRSKEQ